MNCPRAEPSLPGRPLVRFAWLGLALCCTLSLADPGTHRASPVRTQTAALGQDVAGWLERLHGGARRIAYTGTFVVSSGPDISASRIWHACDRQLVERIEQLTGNPRITWRRNDEVVTLSPATRTAVWERREGLRLFPSLPEQPARQLREHYHAKVLGQERVAGLEADVVEFVPRDPWRFAHRIWAARASGLTLKWQTLDAAQDVLEQATFTDLKLQAGLSPEGLARQMAVPAGYQTQRPAALRTTLQAQGWQLREGVPGFVSASCHTTIAAAADGPQAAFHGVTPLQCVLSDGLASVSLFIEAYDPARHARESRAARGATHSLSRRVHDRWVTAVGEVPIDTLQRLAAALEPSR
jgi:sigma-E factor negative regulatory protein RseB